MNSKLFDKETRAYWWGTSTAVVAEGSSDDEGRVIRQWEVWARPDGSRYTVNAVES